VRHIDLPEDKFTFCGSKVESVEYDEEGYPAKEVFYMLDSRGEVYPCKEPELLRKVIQFKKSLNFHIKMWVDGYEDMFMGVDEFLKEFDNPPEWVGKSFRGQLKKKFFGG